MATRIVSTAVSGSRMPGKRKDGSPGLATLVAGTLSLLLAGYPAYGGSLYKWVDENGNVTYQDTPPPDNVEFEESEIDSPNTPVTDDVGRLIEQAALENPISLYTVPVCDNCDLVRLLLEKNAIPFAEKDVRTNIAMQDELQQRTGALTVPTLIIGDKILDGYSRAAITSALFDAGFPIDQPAPASAIEEGEPGTDSSGDSDQQ